MSGMVLDSAVTHSRAEADAVLDALASHPRFSRGRWFEESERVFYTLDLDGALPYADRECERERVRRWLEEVRRERRAVEWLSWLSLRGLDP